MAENLGEGEIRVKHHGHGSHTPTSAGPADIVKQNLALQRQLGISFVKVQKHENGANRIGASKLWQLCDVPDVVPGYFFKGLNGEGARSSQFKGPGRPKPESRSARQILGLNQDFQKIPD